MRNPGELPSRLQFQKELVGMNVQGSGKLKKNFDGGGAFPAFNATDVIRMNVRLLGESFLTEPRLLSIPANCGTNDFGVSFGQSCDRIKKPLKSPHTLRVG